MVRLFSILGFRVVVIAIIKSLSFLSLRQAWNGICGLWVPGADICATGVAAVLTVCDALGAIHLHTLQALDGGLR